MKSTPEDIRAYLADHPAKSAALREIIRHFAIPEADRPAFRRTVKRLAGEGFLVRARGGRYAAPEALEVTRVIARMIHVVGRIAKCVHDSSTG